jgi:hypothetical protein
MSESTTSGRGVASLVSGLGWLAVIGGAGLVVYGLYALFQNDFGLAAGGPLMAGGAVTITLGLLSIINATMAKAMVDTANNTAKLLNAGSMAAVTTANNPDTSDADLPSFNVPDNTANEKLDEAVDDVDNAPTDLPPDIPDIPSFGEAPGATPPPPPPPIAPDMSDPRGWPLAIDEFDLDGHLAMTLEDGSIGVETPQGWRRLPNIDDARTWLSQQSI